MSVMTRSAQPALLRAPPFPGGPVRVSVDSGGETTDEEVFALVRAAQVGGAFWAAPAGLTAPATVVVRPASAAEAQALVSTFDAATLAGALWIIPAGADRNCLRTFPALVAQHGGAVRADVDPWSAIEGAGCVVVHGDDEWLALARIAGVGTQVLSPGRFGAPGDDGQTLDAIARHAITAASYFDPFTGEPATLAATVELLAEWRRLIAANRKIVVAAGMAWWKRKEIGRFLWVPERRLRFAASASHALRMAQKLGGGVAIWPSRVSPALIAQADQQHTPLVRVEDGFVRSVGLGSNLVPPSSVVVDHSGIHFDPQGPSDLETCLNDTVFTPRLLERAKLLRETIVKAGISKYHAGTAQVAPQRQAGRRLVLVPAQVEDDMSVLAGGGGLHSNLELLRRVRALEPDAEIWFRPHPDVDAGHRKGAVPDDHVLRHADRIVRGGGMAALLDVVDAVHVLTSLTGFEALMRGREVTCHGTPFYAGWGLTRDLGSVPDRRKRRLSLDELVAGVLILYPRYLDPVTTLPCPPEVLIRRMAEAKAPNRLGWVAPIRKWQGRLMAMLR